VVFLERDFERDHLAEKSNRTKMGQKIHCPKQAKKLAIVAVRESILFMTVLLLYWPNKKKLRSKKQPC
jgi:hypothetical protein